MQFRGPQDEIAMPRMIESPYNYAHDLADWTPSVTRSGNAFVFELRAAHIALLKSAMWEWDDNYSPGSPAVDAKRPFGNSGKYAIARDIFGIVDESDPETLRAIGVPDNFTELDSDERDDNDEQALMGLWQESALALSVMLHCAANAIPVVAGRKWRVSPSDTWTVLQEK